MSSEAHYFLTELELEDAGALSYLSSNWEVDISNTQDRAELLNLVTEDLDDAPYQDVDARDSLAVETAGQLLELGRERNEFVDNSWYEFERPHAGEPLTNFEDVWRRERNFGSGPLNERADSTNLVVKSSTSSRTPFGHRVGDCDMEMMRSSLVGVTTKRLDNFGVVWRRFADFVGTSYVLGGPMIDKSYFTDLNISEFFLQVAKL
jgi:hypothetical protein